MLLDFTAIFVMGRHLPYATLNYIGLECHATSSLEEQATNLHVETLLPGACQSILTGRGHHLHTVLASKL